MSPSTPGGWPAPQGFAGRDGGWFPDPAGGGGMRWWDGQTWTGLTRPPLEDLAAPPSLRTIVVAAAVGAGLAVAVVLLIAVVAAWS